jgi:hypothetical protein
LSNNSANVNITAGSVGNGGQLNIFTDSGIITLSSSNNPSPLNITYNASGIKLPLTSSGYFSGSVQTKTMQLYDSGLGRYVTITSNNGTLTVT